MNEKPIYIDTELYDEVCDYRYPSESIEQFVERAIMELLTIRARELSGLSPEGREIYKNSKPLQPGQSGIRLQPDGVMVEEYRVPRWPRKWEMYQEEMYQRMYFPESASGLPVALQPENIPTFVAKVLKDSKESK